MGFIGILSRRQEKTITIKVISFSHVAFFWSAKWPSFFQDRAKIDFAVEDLVLQKLNAKKDLAFESSPSLGTHYCV